MTKNNKGGLFGGLAYLGEKAGLGLLSLTEGIWDFTAGHLADWFGADEWADSQFANDWVNYNHADEWYDPGEGWKIAGDISTIVPYAVEKVHYGATQSLEGIHDYVVGGVASLVGADDFAKRMYDDDLGDYTYADRKYNVTDGWRKTAGDIAGGIGTSAPSIAAQFIPVVGPILSPFVAGLGAAGNATKEAYRETGDLGGKEYGYGALVGVTEGGIEWVSGKVGAGAKGIKDIITDGASKSIFKSAAKETAETITKKAIVSGVFKEMGKQALSEGAEEAIAEWAAPYYKRFTYDPNAANATPQEIWYAAFVGGMSGAIMSGGSSGINISQNYSMGNKAINNGTDKTILEKSRYFAEREAVNDTGLEVYKNIKNKYEALQKSLAETNGQYLRMEQKIALGELNHLNALAVTAPFIERSAQSIVFNAEAQAERLNTLGFKDANGKAVNITAEMLTEGVDVTLAQSKNKADHKKFAKQLRKALSSNKTLATVATMEAAGELMMDAKTFAQAAEQGKSWISEHDFHHFVETATPEQKAAYGEEFGIENWDSLSYQAFQNAMAEYTTGPKFSSLIKQQKRVGAAKRIAAENTETMPTSADNMTDGAHKFVTEDGQVLGIIKEGKSYYIYDYASGNISFAQSKTDINKLLSDIQEQKGTRDISAAVPIDHSADVIEQKTSDGILQKDGEGGTIEINNEQSEALKNGREVDHSGDGRRNSTQYAQKQVGKSAGSIKNFNRDSYESGLQQGRSRKRILSTDSEGVRVELNIVQKLSESAIVDSDGHIIAVYHSTNTDFETFDKGDIGFHFGSKAQANKRASDKGYETPKYVRAYLDIKNPVRSPRDPMSWNVKATALNLWSLDIISDAERSEIESIYKRGDNEYQSGAAVRLREMLENKGYDGIVYPNDFEGQGDSYIAFRDDQIIRAEDSSAKNSNSKVSNEATPKSLNDNQSRIDSINPKKIHEYLRENVKGYKALSVPNQAMVRAIIRQGRILGIPDADLLLYAKVATRSGVNIVFDKEATYLGKNKDTGEDVYADGFYERGKNRITVNPEGTRSAKRLLIHELAHAIFKTTDGAIIAVKGVKNLTKDEKDRITKHYAKLHKNLTESQISIKIMDEQNAHYAEGMLSDRAILERLVADKPTLKDRILNFFKGAATDYADDVKLSAEAKKLYRQYKKMFDEFSARNADTNAVERTVRAGESDEREYAIKDDSLIKKYPRLDLNQDISTLDGVPAIRLEDGSVLPFTEPHVQFIKNNDIDVEDIESGGWITDGIYETSERSDTIRYKERMLAKRRMDEKRAAKTDKTSVAFRKRIEAWDGKTEGFAFVIGETPSYLSDIDIKGQKIGKKQVRIDATKVKKIMHDHAEMTIDVIKHLPELLNDPILVMDSKTVSGRLVLLGEVYAEGKPVMMALEINPTTRSRDSTYVDVIKVASAYTRANTQNLINSSNIRYVNKNKSRVDDWLKVNRLQLPLPNSQSNSATNSITQNAQKVNRNAKNVDGKDYALPDGVDSDKVTVSRGELAKLKANYQGDKTFTLNGVQSALKGIEAWSSVPSQIRRGLENDLWRGYNMRLHAQGYELFTEVMYEKLCAVIQQENDFSLGHDEVAKLETQVADALHAIIEGGKPSEKAKLKNIVESDVKREMEKLEQSAAYWRAQYNDLDKRAKVIGNLTNAAQSMKNLKLGIFANASEYKSEIFKGSIEKLSNIQWRGNVSVKSTRKIAADLLLWYSKENPLLEYVSDDNSGYFLEDIHSKLEGVANGQKAFTLSELKDLRDIMGYFTKLVKNYNKVFVDNKYVDALPLAKGFVEVADTNTAVGNVGPHNLFVRYMDSFGNPLSLMKLVDRYQDNGFNTFIFNTLQRAGLDAQIAEMKTLEGYEKFMREHKGYDSKLSETVEYRARKMTRAQLIGLYMTSKREQAQAGLIINGYTYVGADGNSIRVPGWTSEQNISREELAQKVADVQKEIEALLSADDKAYIEVVEAGFEVAKQMKIDRDMQRYGYTNALEGYYYPIRRANTAKSVDTSMKGEIERASNPSFNKDTVQGAKQELYIGGVDQVYLRHIHAMTQYSYLSPAIDTYNKLFNLDISGNKNKPVSVKTQIKEAWNYKGKDNTSGEHLGDKYFRKLIEDIQGISAYDEGGKLMAKMRGNYATFALGANPKVWFTQFSSLFASTSMLDYDSVVASFKMDAKDVDIYCSLAQLRNNDNTAAKAQGVVNKLNKTADVLMKPIGFVDRYVVQRLFAACQIQVQKNGGGKVGTDANKIAAGELLERVILETQQNSLATERSGAMRSSSEFMKAITMFSADAMKVTGKVIDSYGEINAIDRRIKLLQKAQKEGATYLDETVLGKVNLKDETADSGSPTQTAYSFQEYSEHQKKNWSSSRRIVVYRDAQQFEDFVRESKTDERFDKKLYFGAISTDLAQRIEQKTGVNVEKYNCTLGANEIRKIFRDHGNAKKEASRGQRAITENDIYNIPGVVLSADDISLSPKTYNDKPVITFTKVIDGSKMTVSAVVSDKHLDLFVQTAYAGIKKGNLATPTGEQAPINTPEASRGTVSNNIISQDSEKSNIKIQKSKKTISEEIETLQEQKKAANKQLGRSVGAMASSALFMAIVAKMFRGLYHKDRDKDSEEKAKDFVIDFVGNFFGGLPIIKDVYARFAQGYELDNPTYSMINDVLNSASGLMTAAVNLASGEATSQDIAKALRNMLYAGGQVTGLPTRNIYNLVYGVVGFNEKAAYKLDNVFYKKNYRNDLYKYIEDDNAQMVAFTMDLVLEESIGEGVSDTIKSELVSLLREDRSVLPRNISSTITYQGQEYQLSDGQLEAVRAEYASAVGNLDKLFSKVGYKSLSAEDKERAIKYAYDVYYEEALSSALGIEASNNVLVSGVIGVENMALLSVATRGLESDKDENGKTISGSKRKKVITAINSLGLSREKKLLLICAKGYSIQDGDVRGLSASSAKKVLLRYILSLKVSKDEKARLAVMCGFEVTKNGRIVTKSAFSA